jgi:hypothetical protein
MDEISLLKIEALRNAIYHSNRRKVYVFRHRLLMAVIAASTTVMFADATSIISGVSIIGLQIAKAFGAIPVISSILDLIYAPGEKAKDHQVMQKQFFEIIADIEENSVEQIDIGKLKGKMYRIYSDEDVTFRALDATAYNAAMDSFGRDKMDRIKISGFQYIFRNLLTFERSDFRSEREVLEKKQVKAIEASSK